MTWSLYEEIDISSAWHHCPITDDNLFRLSYSNSFNFSSILIAQSELGQNTQLYDLKPLAIREESEILYIEKPNFFDSRRIAFKGIAFSDKRTPTLTLRVESQYMSLVNPVALQIPDSTVNTATGANITVEGAVDTLLAPKSTRRGFQLWNNGNVAVNIGIGFEATANLFSFRLLPGGYFEGPTNYTGIVTGFAPSGSAVVIATEIG